MTEFLPEYITLAIVAVLAFMSPLLAKRLRAPVVVTELVFGMIIGGLAALAQWYFDKPVLIFGDILKFLANLGFVILLFLAGLEFDFQMLQQKGRGPITTGLIVFLLTFVLGMVMLAPLGLGNIFVMAIIMSTTSVGVVVPTLREISGLGKDYKQNIIISALVADFLTMLLLVFIPFSVEGDIFKIALSALIYIPMLALIFYISYKIGSAAMWHFPDTLARFFHGKDPTELGVRASFMFLFFFIVVAMTLGIEAILGAFLAGILLSLLFQEGALMAKKLFGLGYGFFIPVFFIYIGSSFDFSIFTSFTFFWIVPVLFLVSLVNKIVPSFVYIKEHSAREVLAIGVLNSSRLTLLIAAVTVALQYDLIDDSLYSAIIFLSILLCIVSPTTFRWLISDRTKGRKRKEVTKDGR